MLKYIPFALAIFFLFTSPCLAQWTPPPPVVMTTVVEKGSIQEGLKTPGTFTAPHDVIVRAKLDGEIQEILFQDGASVKKGDHLFHIRDAEKKAQLQEAQASVHMYENQLTRAKELKEKGFLAQAKYDTVLANAAQARAQLAIAKEELAKTKVQAPFEGVLSSREVSAGAYVKQADPLVRLQDLDPLRFQFQIPVDKLSLVEQKMDVTATTDSRPGQEFKGKISVIEPRADESTRNVTVFADFPNEKNLLIPGMFGNISILTTDKHEALLIPEEALVIRREGLYVYKVLKDASETETKSNANKTEKSDANMKPSQAQTSNNAKALLVPITVGTRKNDKVEVLSGLQEGDQIVRRGQENITNNGEIEVYNSKK